MSSSLLVTVDTEEEFDWSAPVSPENRAVEHVAELPRLQELFESVGVRPTYVVDWPIATTEKSVQTLRSFADRDACEIGAHCHPWVNPPVSERIEPRNSFLSNLPLELQQEKVGRLTGAIRDAFGRSPTTFKAGRYGIDWRLMPHLAELGYTVDTSVIPYMDFSDEQGPSFADVGNAPFEVASGRADSEAPSRRPLLEVPCTVGFTRRPFDIWSRVHRALAAGWWRRMRPIGVLWHLQILRKNVLSPEVSQLSDMIRLLKVMTREPGNVFNVTLHSPSAAVGYTPYVRTLADRDALLARLRGVLQFALNELGARPLTMREFAEQFHRESAEPAQLAGLSRIAAT